jgi:hypothetical protein
MAEFVPHPLVTRVGLYLARKDVITFPDDVKRPASLLAAIEKGATSGADTADSTGSAAGAIEDDTQSPTQKNTLASALADQANVPELMLVAGYLGGQVIQGADEKWRLLYLDSRLESWLLVLEDAIVVHERLEDDHAASRLRDVLWLRGTTTVVHGTGSRESAGRFLVGEFTRAGDYAASNSGGTFSAATGLLCEASTPGCCFGKRTR